MGLSDIVRAAERRINRRGVERKTAAGWAPEIQPYRGYGTAQRIHVIGRILMEDPEFDDNGDPRSQMEQMTQQAQRGYRQFFTIQVGDLPVTVHAGNQRVSTRTNQNGYFDVTVDNHGLDVGWQEVRVEAQDAEPVTAEVLVTADDETMGLISDIDDTVMVTNLPRALHAAYNSWFKHTNQRQPVEGMAQFYAEVLREHPGAPVFYLSTGAWNTYDTLVKFIEEQGLPKGPLLLTDWGPTPTGLFRSGQEHKKVQLRNLAIDYPAIRWALVGDNGQHDPLTYGEFVDEHPDRVRGVAIRELTPTEHVLSHGTTSSLTGPPRTDRDGVPTIYGADGHELLKRYRLV
ncbi:App1 family protein [Corynebacterium sp.]|uniref:App1 family protein n=1 Tax=Corynebacterium sp. TaxID=1720 RepID=UPI003735AB15